MEESNFGKLTQIFASTLGASVFRNNNGTAWQGGEKVRVHAPKAVPMYPGDLLIRKARLVRFGLGDGSGDHIGWMPIEITQDMVGKKIAVFVSFEEKLLQGVIRDSQIKWDQAVRFAGGLSGFVREGSMEADVKKILLKE